MCLVPGRLSSVSRAAYYFCWAVALIVVASAQLVVAHPGGKNSAGCHRCRTNCSSWGLSSGEYHCHGGSRRSEPPRRRSLAAPPRAEKPEKRSIEVLEERPDSHAGNWISLERQGTQTAEVEPELIEPSVVVDIVTVVDGDTLVARDRGRFYLLRLRGVDAPELGQPFGRNARDWLARQVEGRRVKVKPSKGRCVVAVDIEADGGASLAETQIRIGLAWAAPEAAESWRELEGRARALEVGLWSGRQPEAPWGWRARRMEKEVASKR